MVGVQRPNRMEVTRISSSHDRPVCRERMCVRPCGLVGKNPISGCATNGGTMQLRPQQSGLSNPALFRRVGYNILPCSLPRVSTLKTRVRHQDRVPDWLRRNTKSTNGTIWVHSWLLLIRYLNGVARSTQFLYILAKPAGSDTASTSV